MAGRGIFGSSFIMQNAFHFKGEQTKIKSKERLCIPVSRKELAEPVDPSASAAAVMGALPACLDVSVLTPSMRAVLGAVCVSAGVRVTQDPESGAFVAGYILTLLRLVNGAGKKGGRLSGEKLKQLIISLMKKWIAAPGTESLSQRQILLEAIRRAYAQDVLKGAQPLLCAMTGDPINADTGNYVYEKEDLFVAGRVSLRFQRTYNSMDHRTGSMGKGWRHNYEISLVIESDCCTVLWGDGREEIYLLSETGVPETLFGTSCCLRQEKDGWIYEAAEGITYTFDREGRLRKQTDQNNQELHFKYGSNGKLSIVSNEYRGFLQFQYESHSGMLREIQDHSGRCVQLFYELGRLKEVNNGEGGRYIYDYDEKQKLYRIRNPRDVYVLENHYDDQGRTLRQTFADGGVITCAYEQEEKRTLVVNQCGGRTAYVHDDRFRNIRIVHENGEEVNVFNDQNQLLEKRDRKGNRTRFSYDNRNNISQIVYADGEKHTMTYDTGNRLLTYSVNGTVKLKNSYDTKGRLIQSMDALGRCRELEYDESGHIVGMKLPDGSQMLFVYDNYGNVCRITDATGGTTAYMYDEVGRVVRATDGNGNKVIFAYDTGNHITSVTDAAGNRHTYEYTKNGKLLRAVDAQGAVTKWEYDAMNRVKSITGPDGETVAMEYDPMGNVVRRILPNGAYIVCTYDTEGLLQNMILPDGGTIQYEYDKSGNRTAIVYPDGGRRTFVYDERDRIIKDTDPGGVYTEYTYDMEGRLTRETDMEGRTVCYAYDEAGQLVSETDKLGNKICYTYNELGKLSSVTDAKKRQTVYVYEPGGRLSKIEYSDGTYETFVYDRNSNVICRRNRYGNSLHMEYDCLNRLVCAECNPGGRKSYTYDKTGNMVSTTDELGRVTRYTYSPGGRLTSVLDAVGNRTEYAYDTMGNLICLCRHEGNHVVLGLNGFLNETVQNDGNVRLTRYERDTSGRIVAVVNPLGDREQYAYDQMGRIICRTDRDGYETRYLYNQTGDVKDITYGDGRSVTFSYDSLRRLTEIRDWLGVTCMEMDEAGRLKRTTDHKGNTIFCQWNRDGERQAFIYPDGKKVSYIYDEMSRLCQLTDGYHKVQYLYDTYGRLKEKILPDGMRTLYAYDLTGRLGGIIHKKNGTFLELWDYEYDMVGNRTAIHKKRAIAGLGEAEQNQCISEENGSWKYQYDCLNRLTEVQKDGRCLVRYKYDAFGNRIRKEAAGTTVRYQYDKADRLIREEGVYPEKTYQYDARGNLIAVLHGKEITGAYRYDETGRLLAAGNTEGAAVGYEYDGMGNRVGKKEYILTDFALDNMQNLDFTNKKPVRSEEFLLDYTRRYNNLLRRMVTDENESHIQDYIWDYMSPSFMTEEEKSYIYLQDGLGSIVRLVETSENSQTIYGYDEFGQDLYGTQGDVQPFGYTGYCKDNITGAYFAQAREYLPAQGRFAGEDILEGRITEPTTLNRYAYCLENPLRWVDLDGRKPSDVLISPVVKLHYGRNQFQEKILADMKGDKSDEEFIEYIRENAASNSSNMKNGYWLKASESANAYHRNPSAEQTAEEAAQNEKYLYIMGVSSCEIIIGPVDGTDVIITAKENMGTFNYFDYNVKKDGDQLPGYSRNALNYAAGHFITDMLPYYVMGNTPEEPQGFSAILKRVGLCKDGEVD